MNKNEFLCSLAGCLVGFGAAWYIQKMRYSNALELARSREASLVNEIYELNQELNACKDKERFQNSDPNGGYDNTEPERTLRFVPDDGKPATVFGVAWHVQTVNPEEEPEYEVEDILPGEINDEMLEQARKKARNKPIAPEAATDWRSISSTPVIMNSAQASEFDFYDQDYWTWYEGDQVMADGLDNAFGDWEHYIGKEWLDAFGPEGVNPDDPDVVYIRRDVDGVVIEVSRRPEAWAEEHEDGTVDIH